MYEFDSRVRLSEVDQDRRMTLNTVLNYFQDCSSFHGEDLGVGVEFLEARDRMWVLSSWKIRVDRYPELGEHIKVGTWAYDFSKMTGGRNFRMLDEQGSMVACAESLWVLMDTRRMRPTRIEEEMSNVYGVEERLDMGEDTGHIQIPEDLEEKEAFQIHKIHLDVNHHVNNGQYVQMAAEYLPEGFRIHQMRAEYKKSAVLNDMIYPRVGRWEDRYTAILGNETGKPYAVIEFR